MSRVNAYANFITKQRRIENNGLLRSGSSSDDGELLNERIHWEAIGGFGGAFVGAATGAGLYLATGSPEPFTPFVVFKTIGSTALGGAIGAAAGFGAGALKGHIADEKEDERRVQFQKIKELQNSQLEAIKAKNEHLRAVALAERKRQVEGRLHSLRNQHGVNMTRIPTGNGPNDTAVRITGGPLPQGHEIVFHDNHSVSNDNEPSEFTWEHNVAMQRMTSPTGEGVTVKKPVDSSSHSDLDSSITNLNAHLQRMGRKR